MSEPVRFASHPPHAVCQRQRLPKLLRLGSAGMCHPACARTDLADEGVVLDGIVVQAGQVALLQRSEGGGVACWAATGRQGGEVGS